MPAGAPNNRGLTSSDQLLGIFAVNFTIVLWVGIAFSAWYESSPHLPLWIYFAEVGILGFSLLFSVLDVFLVRLLNIARGDQNGSKPITVNALLLKITVVVLTVLYIFVLWRLAEETGGVISPFAPFLTAPALFAPFVTKNGLTIVLLSILVAIAIFLSGETETLGLESLVPYQGTAAAMVLLAGLLTALRMWVAKRGAPLTGEGS